MHRSRPARLRADGAEFIDARTAGEADEAITKSTVYLVAEIVTIQVWDSHEPLKAWFNGADYQAALKVGETYATFRRFAVEGVSQ